MFAVIHPSNKLICLCLLTRRRFHSMLSNVGTRQQMPSSSLASTNNTISMSCIKLVLISVIVGLQNRLLRCCDSEQKGKWRDKRRDQRWYWIELASVPNPINKSSTFSTNLLVSLSLPVPNTPARKKHTFHKGSCAVLAVNVLFIVVALISNQGFFPSRPWCISTYIYVSLGLKKIWDRIGKNKLVHTSPSQECNI